MEVTIVSKSPQDSTGGNRTPEPWLAFNYVVFPFLCFGCKHSVFVLVPEGGSCIYGCDSIWGRAGGWREDRIWQGLPGSETGLTQQGLLKTKKKKKKDINLVPHFGLSLSDDISFSPLVQTDFKRYWWFFSPLRWKELWVTEQRQTDSHS